MNPNFGLEHSPGYVMVDIISRFMSPYQLNPMDVNPMRTCSMRSSISSGCGSNK